MRKSIKITSFMLAMIISLIAMLSLVSCKAGVGKYYPEGKKDKKTYVEFKFNNKGVICIDGEKTEFEITKVKKEKVEVDNKKYTVKIITVKEKNGTEEADVYEVKDMLMFVIPLAKEGKMNLDLLTKVMAKLELKKIGI